jgi:hypothetical protein
MQTSFPKNGYPLFKIKGQAGGKRESSIVYTKDFFGHQQLHNLISSVKFN